MQKKALVVDSDYFFVEFVSELLEKRGYQVSKAYNGKEGIAQLEQGAVDVLFADLVMPKVDGRRFFQYARTKFNGNRFPIVALSGTMIEQLSDIQLIGADFFIAKGPIGQLAVQLNEFMVKLESQPFYPPLEKKVLAAGNVFPRRDAVELLKLLQFHQAVIESISAGIVVVDTDTRIINANRAALEIIRKSSTDVLNRPITDIFLSEDKPKLAQALKQVYKNPWLSKEILFINYHSLDIRLSISRINLDDSKVGWVVVLEECTD
jgi:PAS domain S-box-containing protein